MSMLIQKLNIPTYVCIVKFYWEFYYNFITIFLKNNQLTVKELDEFIFRIIL